MSQYSKEEVVSILMTAIDKELGANFLQRKGIDKFRAKITNMIERDYRANPKEISDFIKSIDCRLWSLKMICHITFIGLSKKSYFGKNGITPTGILYYDLYCMSITAAASYKYIDQEELNICLRNINELVRCEGYTELFRYNPKDNYLDFYEDNYSYADDI